MKLLKNKYNSPAYWTQLIQLEIYDHIRNYLQQNNLSKEDFANQLGESSEYITQILNGDFDQKLSKLTELALHCGLVPKIEFVPLCDAASVKAELNASDR
ncbi:MAG: helix-turn-helix transcriptional regulator [Bacteroidales bacterium]|nr:helix-turn-helix transcriptional regulator [Bacteroidales bacterium]